MENTKSQCVVTKNNSLESKQSIFTKKFLTSFNFKQATLDNVIKNRKFVESKNEQATPSKKILKKHNVETSNFNGRNIYTISPKEGLTDTVVLYLHGGAYMANFLPIHWNFISKLIDNTGVTVIAPDYPLAPEETWLNAFEMLEFLNNIIFKKFKNCIFLGDSAGAGLALAWTMELKKRELQLPKALVLLSPWLDVTMKNPEISKTEDWDPCLSREALAIAGSYWSGDIDIKSWQVSPINGNLDNLPPISLFTGTADILHSDARLLKDKMFSLGINITYKEYSNMIHDWMFFKMPEAKECLTEIFSILNNLSIR